jgi:hypothetical protein
MKSRIFGQALSIALAMGGLTAHPAIAQLPFDVRGTSSGVAPVVALTRAPLSLDITFQNLGTNTIWEMQVNYRINHGPVQVMTYPFPAGGELVAQGGRQTIRHTARWTPPSVGQYTIKCWASGLNATQLDGNPANDTVTNVVTIVAREAPRLSVLEIFTSGSCPICGAGAPALEALEDRQTSRITCLHYPQNIPGLGDFYRTPETVGRRAFYNIQAVPYAVLDGLNARPANQLTDAQIVSRQAEPCFLSLDAVYTRQNATRSVTVQAAVTALGPGASPNLVLRAVVVEPRVSPSAASNGQLYLPHLVRKLLPTPRGAAVGALPMRATRTLQTAWTVPLTVPSCNIGALEVVVFAQDTVTHEIQQAVRARLNGVLATTAEITPASALGCWLTPNPATNQEATISLSLAKGAQIGGEVLDALGRVVLVVPSQPLSAGMHAIPLVLTNAKPGVYALRLLVDDKTVSRRLVIE